MSRAMIFAAFVSVVFLAGCSDGFFYLGERRGPYLKESSYSEVRSALKNRQPLSSEQLETLYGECPRPNGIFKNDASDEGSSRRLDHFFRVEGFVMPATSYPGGREDDEPLPVSGKPIDLLLGSEKNGVRQRYLPKEPHPPEKGLTLELRSLGLGRFHIGVKSSISGRSAESDRGWINFPAEREVRCENGALKGFWVIDGKARLGWELFVDAETGDIVLHSPGGVFYSPEPLPERFYRFERIGK